MIFVVCCLIALSSTHPRLQKNYTNELAIPHRTRYLSGQHPRHRGWDVGRCAFPQKIKNSDDVFALFSCAKANGGSFSNI
jgi:hypothetical protein